MASVSELLNPGVAEINSQVIVPDENYSIGGDRGGRFVASIHGGEGVLVVPAEISDDDVNIFDPVRRVLVMASCMDKIG